MDYKTLNAMPPEAFLIPANFVTDWDTMNLHKAKEKFDEGVEIGNNAKRVYISMEGTWGATMKDGSSLTSYEGIGYHVHTSSLLEGFLASNAEIVVYRRGKGGKIIRLAKVTSGEAQPVA